MKKGSTRGTSAGNSGPNTANSTNLEVKKERSGTQNSSRAIDIVKKLSRRAIINASTQATKDIPAAISVPTRGIKVTRVIMGLKRKQVPKKRSKNPTNLKIVVDVVLLFSCSRRISSLDIGQSLTTSKYSGKALQKHLSTQTAQAQQAHNIHTASSSGLLSSPTAAFIFFGFHFLKVKCSLS